MKCAHSLPNGLYVCDYCYSVQKEALERKKSVMTKT
jgi:hypothetical protein